MDKVQSILLAVERDEVALPALEKTLGLARMLGAGVELFLCDAERAFAFKREFDARGVAETREACLADTRRWLEGLREAAGAGDIAIDAACESPLYVGIVQKALRSRPDLLATSLPRRGLSENDWALVRTCPVPLLLVRDRTWRSPPRIAAAVDISGNETPSLTRTILRTAAFVSTRCGGELELLYGERATDAAQLEARRVALEQRAATEGARARSTHVVAGEPADALPEFAASRGYDLMVLGALTHQKALTALVGTLTARLIDRVQCDFLLVKSPWFECPIG